MAAYYDDNMNRNIAAIKTLYETGFAKLHEQISALVHSQQDLGDYNEAMRNQVRWIQDVAKTLVVVSQLENARQAPPTPGAQNPAKTIANTQVVSMPNKGSL